MKKLLYLLLMANSLWLTSCSINKQISKQANKSIFADSNFLPAHVGISIYDPSTNQYLYNYQGDKYFVPASNTKLLTCYAAMKYLGDSLVAGYVSENDSIVKLLPAGDPTFLHKDFKTQSLYEFLKKNNKKQLNLLTVIFFDKKGRIIVQDQFNNLGRGWAWDDYQSDYMIERSVFPLYGNMATFSVDANNFPVVVPSIFKDSLQNGMDDEMTFLQQNGSFNIDRISKDKNHFIITSGKNKTQSIPIVTGNTEEIIGMIKDTLAFEKITYNTYVENVKKLNAFHSQPTDSLLKPMMHRSDNFFAEQSLLMVSNETLGYMSDTKIIDSLLQTDYKNMPQKPKWVDGSGLSRYNLITPQDFVFVLNKMKQDFSWERITTILPTGNEGTLVGLYKNHVGKIYAKTGTLSNNVALSGFITTNKGKQLIFSILVNNHQTSASNIRKAVEKFLTSIIDKN